jgi:O-antigen ligase
MKGDIKSVPKPVIYTGLALGLWWIFSTFFALHRPTALNGVFGRYNGLWTHEIFLVLFFLTASMEVDERRAERIIKLFIAALIPVSLYALIQYFQWDPIPWSTRWSRSVSTIGHGVPLAALLGMAIPFIVLFLFKAGTHWKKGGWLFCLFLFLAAMVSTLSRGPWIATFIATMIVVGFRFKDPSAFVPAIPHKNSPGLPLAQEKRKNGDQEGFKRILQSINQKKGALFIFLFLLIILAASFMFSGRGQKITNRLKTFAALKMDTSFYGRLLYYQAALRGIQDHPLVGIGFENFRIIYPRYRVPLDNEIFSDTIPTMVHNGYLQTALTNGVPALILYLVFLAMILSRLWKTFRKSVRNRQKVLVLTFLASMVGFLIQDLSGWLDIALTPFFWVILGLSLALTNERGAEKHLAHNKKITMVIWAGLLVCALFLVILTLEAVTRLSADRLFGLSQPLSIKEDWPEIESNLKKGLTRISDDSYYEDQAGVYYIRRLGVTGEPASYRQGEVLLEKAYRHNPFDPYVLIHRIDLDQVAMGKQVISRPAEFTQWAMNKLLTMDRNNPTIYKAMARLKIREKKFPEALALIEKANLLNRGAPNPREEWTAAQHGLFLELVKQKNYSQALKVLETVVTEYPDDDPSYVLMGNLYEVMKEYKKARDAFSAALNLSPDNQNAKEGLRRMEQAGKNEKR